MIITSTIALAGIATLFYAFFTSSIFSIKLITLICIILIAISYSIRLMFYFLNKLHKKTQNHNNF
jgi:hypothetical protein